MENRIAELNGARLFEGKISRSSRPSRSAKRTVRSNRYFTRGALQLLASGAAAVVPCSVFAMSHFELPGYIQAHDYVNIVIAAVIIVAGLLYSLPTIVQWARSWTHCPHKALGFGILLEAVMSGCHILPISCTCLAFLTGINALVAFAKASGLVTHPVLVALNKSHRKH